MDAGDVSATTTTTAAAAAEAEAAAAVPASASLGGRASAPEGAGGASAAAQQRQQQQRQQQRLMIRPTEARIARLLNDVDADPSAAVRPTEAQLRWAQFTRRQKAEYTRAMVGALMFRPADVGDVAGAREGDGDSSSSDSGDDAGTESEGGSGGGSSSEGEGEGSSGESESEGGGGDGGGGPREEWSGDDADDFRDRERDTRRGAESQETRGTRPTPVNAVQQRGSGKGSNSIPRAATSDFSAPCASSSPPAGGGAAGRTKRKRRRRRRRRRRSEAKERRGGGGALVDDKKKKKVPVSRGRRALLRVSARAVEERRRAAAAAAAAASEASASSERRRRPRGGGAAPSSAATASPPGGADGASSRRQQRESPGTDGSGFDDPHFPDGTTGGKTQRWGRPRSSSRRRLEAAEPEAGWSDDGGGGAGGGAGGGVGGAAADDLSACFGDDFAASASAAAASSAADDAPPASLGSPRIVPPARSPAAAPTPTPTPRAARPRNPRGRHPRATMTPSTRRFTAELDDSDDESRVRRFEEAFWAMAALNAETAAAKKASRGGGGGGANRRRNHRGGEGMDYDDVESQSPPPAARRRWTRGPDVPVMSSVDGRTYDDLQRTPCIRHPKGSPRNGAGGGFFFPDYEPGDRAASWMTAHIPPKPARNNDGGLLLPSPPPNLSADGPTDFRAAEPRRGGEEPEEPIRGEGGGEGPGTLARGRAPSPGRAKFDEIVLRFQSSAGSRFGFGGGGGIGGGVGGGGIGIGVGIDGIGIGVGIDGIGGGGSASSPEKRGGALWKRQARELRAWAAGAHGGDGAGMAGLVAAAAAEAAGVTTKTSRRSRAGAGVGAGGTGTGTGTGTGRKPWAAAGAAERIGAGAGMVGERRGRGEDDGSVPRRTPRAQPPPQPEPRPTTPVDKPRAAPKVLRKSSFGDDNLDVSSPASALIPTNAGGKAAAPEKKKPHPSAGRRPRPLAAPSSADRGYPAVEYGGGSSNGGILTPFRVGVNVRGLRRMFSPRGSGGSSSKKDGGGENGSVASSSAARRQYPKKSFAYKRMPVPSPQPSSPESSSDRSSRTGGGDELVLERESPGNVVAAGETTLAETAADELEKNGAEKAAAAAAATEVEGPPPTREEEEPVNRTEEEKRGNAADAEGGRRRSPPPPAARAPPTEETEGGGELGVGVVGGPSTTFSSTSSSTTGNDADDDGSPPQSLRRRNSRDAAAGGSAANAAADGGGAGVSPASLSSLLNMEAEDEAEEERRRMGSMAVGFGPPDDFGAAATAAPRRGPSVSPERRSRVVSSPLSSAAASAELSAEQMSSLLRSRIATFRQDIIDTDLTMDDDDDDDEEYGDASSAAGAEAGGGGDQHPDPLSLVGALVLSPTILTRRLRQASRAVRDRDWERAGRLMSANPWLAEMTDPATERHLLHELALHGAGGRRRRRSVDGAEGRDGDGGGGAEEDGGGGSDSDDGPDPDPPAPEGLFRDLLERYPPAARRFDRDGNLPLHMACASSASSGNGNDDIGNATTIRILGEAFPGGASVRNDDGMLPLHLAVLSCAAAAERDDDSGGSGGVAGGVRSPSSEGVPSPTSEGAVRLVLGLFPGAVGVRDNDGNLPLHLAAGSLRGDAGAEVVYLLLDAAEGLASQLRLPVDAGLGTMLSEAKKPAEDEDDDDEVGSLETDITAPTSTASPAVGGADAAAGVRGETSFCNLVKNGDGHTPLVTAVRAMAGWQVIEALVRGSGGRQAALERDENLRNAFHLLVDGEFSDAASALSLLKVVPRAASIPDGEGVLPIEAACLNFMPREVILALVLVDLPVDLDDKDGLAGLADDKGGVRLGGSWWFLNCECDDSYADIVREVLSICTYRQARELCFFAGRRGGSVISRATPGCKRELRRALRFAGRFEFLGSRAVRSDETLGLKVFDALDFGADDEPLEEGRRVLLKCYGREETYTREISLLQEVEFDSLYVEDISYFCVHDLGMYTSDNAPSQYCVAVERPTLTLARVVAGMPKDHEYRRDSERLQRYLGRVIMVLRLIGKGVRHLHREGVVHGNISLENCGKFGDQWKIMGVAKARLVGEKFPSSLLGENSPPESIDSRGKSFKKRLACSPAMDIWAFGKLMYEVLVGDDLIIFNKTKKTHHDIMALATLGAWDQDDLQGVVDQLTEAGIGTLGIDLVTHCLCPLAEDRPESMEVILKHPFWKNARRSRGKSLNVGSTKRSEKEQRETTSMI